MVPFKLSNPILEHSTRAFISSPIISFYTFTFSPGAEGEVRDIYSEVMPLCYSGSTITLGYVIDR